MAHVKDGDDGCLSCQESLPEEGNAMTCCECGYRYHVGNCSGVSEATFKTKGEAYRKTWRCSTCRTAKTRGGSQSDKGKKDQPVDVAALLLSINRKLDSLLPLKETVDGIEQSVQAMSEKYDEVLARLTQHDNNMKDLRKRVEKLEQKDPTEEVKQLRQTVHELEWRSRRLNLEIHGIPQVANENLLDKVNEVAQKLSVPILSEAEVTSMHRLPSNPNRVPGVIVRFSRQTTRDRWLASKSNLRRTETTIYVQENMTRQNRALLSATKTWAREHGYQFAWHKNGKILVRKKAGDRAVVIESEGKLGTLE